MGVWGKIKKSVKGDKREPVQGKQGTIKKGDGGPAQSKAPDVSIATSSQGLGQVSLLPTNTPPISGGESQSRQGELSPIAKPHQVSHLQSSAGEKRYGAEAVQATNQTGASIALISSTQADMNITASQDGLASDLAPSESMSIHPVHLWDLAYDSLKTEVPKLVDAYERITSHEMDELPSDGSATTSRATSGTQKNEIEQNDPEKRWLQMDKAVQAGLKRTEKEAKAKKGLDTIVNIVLSIKPIVDSSLQAIPHAALAWSGCCFALQILLNPVQQTSTNRDGIIYVARRMNWYLQLSNLLLNQTKSAKFDGARSELHGQIVDLYKSILLYQMQSVCSYYRRILSFVRDLVKLDDWDGKLTDIKESEKNFRHDSDAYRAQYQIEILKGISEAIEHQAVVREEMKLNEDNQKFIHGLLLTDPSVDMRRIETRKDKLLENSYVWILQRPEFLNWRDGEGGQLLWVKGEPGKGKTMLAIGLIRELLKDKWDNDYLSFFFCEAGSPTSNNAAAVLRGLLFQLVSQQISLIEHVRKPYERAGASLFDPKGQNTYIYLLDIFTDMLKDADLKRIQLVVDALDECEVGLPQLLDFIGNVSQSNRQVKWLVTSRPRRDIVEHLRVLRLHTHCVELDLGQNAQDNVANAVNAYIAHKVQELSRRKGYSAPVELEIKRHLEQNADGTFLWVALVCQQLADPMTLSYNTLRILKGIPKGLTKVYELMLEKMTALEDKEDLKICTQILAAATLAHEPLCTEELISLANLSKKMSSNPQFLNEFMELCGSFLIIREKFVYFIHQSARQFCQKQDSDIFPEGRAKVHLDIVSRSLLAMNDDLRNDVYGLNDPGASVNQPECPRGDPLVRVRYSCTNWVHHLMVSDKKPWTLVGLHDDGKIHHFLQSHLLHWFEALCWMKLLPRGIVMLETLCSLLKDDKNSRLLSLMRDAKRFILFGKTGIEIAPLQIYASTLLLSPETSLIKQLFLHERPAWIEHCSGVETFWSPLLQTIEATISEESPYNAVFSPDGSLVASFAKHDRAIGIWSAETGTLQRKLECSADDGTGRVVFSPQNHWVAVAGWDNEVQLWSLDDESECKTLEGHTEIRDIAFSHTGKLMACASEKNYIRIWDMEDLPSHRDLKDHGTMVVFAPTDDQLASASSDDHTIRIWNVKTGAQINAVNYQSGLYTMKTLRWKRQVRHLMRDPGPTNAIQLWDSIGQKLIFSVEPNDMLPSYDMSPDESCLVALPNHDSYNIEFWDIATRNRKNVFKMHDEAYDCNFSFSNDGTQLAIINSHRGGPITLLNVMMAMNNSEEDLSEGHRSGIELLFFSKDGKQLVSLSSGDQDSATVCLWDVKSGLLQWPVNILGKCSALALTPDGRYLMANSYTDTIPRAYMLRIWNTATGILVYEFNCGDLDIHTKSFSQDGSWLALPCDETIKLWNIDSKKWYDIDSESGLPLDKVFFSPNSRQIVACSRGRMFLWEMKNSQLHEAGKETVDIEAHHLGDGRWLDDIKDIRTTKDNWLPYNDIMSLSFSCDGCWLAIIFRDETVSLLDIKNGGTRIPLDLKDVQIIRFSPDGNFFATSSGYRFVQFWDFKSKALIREIEGHPNSVSRMTFSKDGNQIIILGGTTADPMIRILDVETLEIRDELWDYESKWSRGSDDFRYRYRPNRPTDRGTMMLERAGLRSPYSISKDGSWITWHGHRVLWLPREYRPERLDIQENAIAMGFHSGRVVTFSFADDDSAEQPRPQCASEMRIGEERH